MIGKVDLEEKVKRSEKGAKRRGRMERKRSKGVGNGELERVGRDINKGRGGHKIVQTRGHKGKSIKGMGGAD